MAIKARSSFEARVISFPPNLAAGSVGVEILDNEGNVTMPRTIATIEDPVGSGSYVAQLIAPDAPGQYTIMWDWGPGDLQKGWEEIEIEGYGDPIIPGTPVSAPAIAAVPHFDFPFHFNGSRVAVVEQDTADDVINCCEAILLTHVGFRPEVPTFGRPELAFMTQPIGSDFLSDLVVSQEPRAELVVTEEPDRFDEMLDRIQIQVNSQEGT